VVGGSEGAAQGVAGTIGLLCTGKNIDRLPKAPLEQLLVARKWNAPAGLQFRFRRQMKTMDRVEEKERPHSFVKVLAAQAERCEGVAFREQFVKTGGRADFVEGTIPFGIVRRSDEVDETERHGGLLRRQQFDQAPQHFVPILSG
jgi:hypothetical protein